MFTNTHIPIKYKFLGVILFIMLNALGVFFYFTYTTFSEDKKLFVDIPGQGKHEMLPMGKDAFFMRAGPVKLRFKRDAKGTLEEMAIEPADGDPSVAQKVSG